VSTLPAASGARAPLGLWSAISLVVGCMIGSGVFLLPATLAPYGAASLVGWGLTLAGALMLAIVFSWLATGITRGGGPYAYAREAFGDQVGFGVAWSYWTCNWTGNAALSVAFAGSLGAVFPEATATPLRGAACAMAALAFCTAVNVAGVRQGARVQLLTTVLKLLPLVLFGIIGVAYVQMDYYVPFNPSGQSLWQVGSAVAALTLWAFLGLEAATVTSSSVANPERNVPRATIIGVLIAGLATMLTCTVVLGLLPAETLKTTAAPMADAASRLWGGGAGIAVGIVATISCFGALNGWVLLQAQTPMAAAHDGLFPKLFGRVDRLGTPVAGLVLSSTLAGLLMLTNYSKTLVGLFQFSILLATAACLLPYAVCTLAWWKLHPEARIGRRLVAIGGLVYSVWALVGTGREPLLWGAALLLAGVPVYWWSRRT
jgi:APA family basic amino acid/polyamine antiporter